MLFVILRSDGTTFRAAHEIDPEYSQVLEKARSAGVEVHACNAVVSPTEIRLLKPMRV